MIDTDKYEGHTPAEEWGDIVYADGYRSIFLDDDVYATDLDTQLMTDAPLLFAEVKRLRKALEIEEQIVQAFYEYREDCCFDHCEAWMLESGHRVMVKIDDDEQSEWKVEVEE